MENRETDAEQIVNAPPHYRAGDLYETIRVIEAWQLPYHLGNVIKYVSRWERKGGLEDLKKARWYLNRFIEMKEKEYADDSDRRRQHDLARREEVRRGRTTPFWQAILPARHPEG